MQHTQEISLKLQIPVTRRYNTAWHNRTSSSLGCYFQEQESPLAFLTHRNRHKELGKLRRQKNIFQIKEQEKTTPRNLSEIEMSYV